MIFRLIVADRKIRIDLFNFTDGGMQASVRGDQSVGAEETVSDLLMEIAPIVPFNRTVRMDVFDRLINEIPDKAADPIVVFLEIIDVFLKVPQRVLLTIRIC